MAVQKFRPYFSMPDLVIIRDALAGRPGATALHTYLSRYIMEVQEGFRKANHVTKNEFDLAGLGFEDPNLPPMQTPEQTYFEWLSQGKNFARFTPAKLSVINQYRYENDLMTPEEEKEHEKSLGLDY